MKTLRWLLGSLMISGALTALNASAQTPYYVVDFEGAGETKTAYASGTVALSGLNWDMTEALIGTAAADWKNGLRSARLRGYGISSMTMLDNLTNGIGAISFQYRRYGTDSQVDWVVEYTTNDIDWVQIGSEFTALASDDVQTFGENVGVDGNAKLRIKRFTDDANASNNRINIDDINVYAFGDSLPSGSLPILTLDPAGNEKEVRENELISFDVTASQEAGDVGQETSLVAVQLPLGATFEGVTGAAPVTAAFSWTPDTVGIYTSIFTAADAEGVVTQEVLITVLEGFPLGSVVIDFEGVDETKGSYASGTVTLSGYDWDLTEALIGTAAADWKNGLRSGRLRGYGTTSMTMLEDLTNGLGSVTFQYSRYGTDSGQISWVVEYSVTAGGSWIAVGTPFTADETVQNFSEIVDIGGNIRVRIRPEVVDASTPGDARMNIDDIVLTPSDEPPPGNLPPAISLNPDGATKNVLVENLITFDVLADQVSADAGQNTELAAVELPAGAVFVGTTGAAPVQSTFNWTPDTVGVYTSIFTATDVDGVATQIVTITVQGPGVAPEGTLVAYDFDGAVNFPSFIAENLGWTLFEVSPSQTLSYATGNPGDAVSASGWDTTNSYWEFSLDVASGYEMSVTNISFDERSTSTGPTNWVLRSSLDAYATDLASGSILNDSLFDPQSQVLAIVDATGTVTFRLFGDGASAGAGTWRIDNLVLSGTVALAGGGPGEPDVVGFSMTATGVGATITTEVGFTYSLEYTTDPVANPVVWVAADSVVGDGNNQPLDDTDPADASRIYRILAE